MQLIPVLLLSSFSCAIYCTFEVRWGLKNESHIKGSIDNAIRQAFPEYTSRRYSHWKKQYHQFDWESIPDRVASRISQLPNSYRAAVGARLRGPGMGSYYLPKPIEDVMEKHHASKHLQQILCKSVFFLCHHQIAIM